MRKKRQLILLIGLLILGLFGRSTVHGQQTKRAAAETVRTAIIKQYYQAVYQLTPQLITYQYHHLAIGVTSQATVKFTHADYQRSPFLQNSITENKVEQPVKLAFYPAQETKNKPWVNSTNQALDDLTNGVFASVINFPAAANDYYLRQTDGNGPFQVNNVAFTPTTAQKKVSMQHYAQLNTEKGVKEQAALQAAVTLGLVGHELDLSFTANRSMSYGYAANETGQLIRDNLASELKVDHLAAGTKLNVWVDRQEQLALYTFVYQAGDFKQVANSVSKSANSSQKYLKQLIAKKTVYMTTLRELSGGGYGPTTGEVSVFNFFPLQRVSYYDNERGKYELHKGSLSMGSSDNMTGTF
ncbi:hypothetical protein [Loigolactobacillus zhaoyuanensis]|uniref:hypothetical protein n=1 Tax=Loigolactobacillus zhaoyuanensis TaxID=2486017 RepID=UPI000F74779F|nr:hypothetical protein [Loigolactobacillus zhaoyuanensis]